jgi:hypothetical protein
MKQEITIDDLDGKLISDGGGTFVFSLQDREYEIDLSLHNFEKLKLALKPFLDTARSRRSRSSLGKSALDTAAPPVSDAREVRAWANGNGYALGTRGRIPDSVVRAFDDARRTS